MKLADAFILWRPNTADVQVLDRARLNHALDSGPDRWMWMPLTAGDFADTKEKPKVAQSPSKNIFNVGRGVAASCERTPSGGTPAHSG